MPLNELIVLEGELKNLLTRSPLRLRRLLPVLLVHVEASFGLRRRRSDVSVVLMDRLNVFLILLGLLFLICPEALDLRLKLLLSLAERTDLGVQVLNLGRLALHLVALLLQLRFQRFLILPEATLQRRYLVLEVLNLTCVHLLTLIVLNLLCAHLTQLLLPLFILLDAQLERLTLHQEL